MAKIPGRKPRRQGWTLLQDLARMARWGVENLQDAGALRKLVWLAGPERLGQGGNDQGRCAQAAMRRASIAPEMRSTSRPPENRIIVGIERMP